MYLKNFEMSGFILFVCFVVLRPSQQLFSNVKTISCVESILWLDPDQMASEEASRSGSTLFSIQPHTVFKEFIYGIPVSSKYRLS